MKEAEIEPWIYHRLKKDIGRNRYEHSVNVMNTSIELAKIYNCSIKKAGLAGLLHDCGKFQDKKRILKYTEDFGIMLDNVMVENIVLIHSPLGSVLAEKIYEIHDKDILNAIRYHTTGREKMSLLEKIIYVADVIEPSRDYDGVEEIRDMAYEDIDKSLIYSLNRTIKLLVDKGNLIHLDTIKARNHLVILEKLE